MKQDLVAEFFTRDLSDSELAALRNSLASEEAALQFSQKAKDFHRTLGAMAVVAVVAKLATTSLKGAGTAGAASGTLSTGAALAGKLMVVKAVGAALGAAIIAGGAVATYKSINPPVVAVVTPVHAIEAAPAPQVAPVTKRQAVVQAPAQPATQRGKQLVIRLSLEEAAVVETVVMNAEGNFVSSLGKLNMEAGVNRLVWNGRAADGSALAAGRYQIVTRWNGKEMTRWVELQAASAD